MDAPAVPHVTRPVMLHHWRHVTFLHWPYQPAVVQRLLPPGLEVESVDGQAWIGLLPFRMEDVRLPGLPAAPRVSRFAETNVRTYVRGPDGQPAIWFFSLDAASLPAVLGARASYWLPYCWAQMSVELDGSRVSYTSRRLWPGPRSARCHVGIEVGDPLAGGELQYLDEFLTARYRLYSVVATRLVTAYAQHAPWPLARARVLELDQDLVQAAGLPPPQGPPLVHYSPGVAVRIGAWKPVPGRVLPRPAGAAPPAAGQDRSG